jgi:glutathione synthase
MVHLDPSDPSASPAIKQVEFNTIASSFGGLSGEVSQLHNVLSSIRAYPQSTYEIIKTSSMPISESANNLAAGLAAAHRAYGTCELSRETCVLFIVQDPERNVFDQRHLEWTLWKQDIRVFRLPFHRTLTDTRLDTTRKLLYTPPHTPTTQYEVTTVYFRAGYAPEDYPSANDWAARAHLERSNAIKCPSILTHLAGCKKVQQVLATPSSPHLERFLGTAEKIEAVRKTFAPIYPLDASEAGLEAKKLATDPQTALRYVLKPQREGGGNNIYRRAIPKFLKELPEASWPAYILMEMIEPPAQRNAIFRNGEVQRGGVICELGIYGACLWRSGEKSGVLENTQAGYLLRTKGDQSEEGGVAAGFGAIDSVCLV